MSTGTAVRQSSRSIKDVNCTGGTQRAGLLPPFARGSWEPTGKATRGCHTDLSSQPPHTLGLGLLGPEGHFRRGGAQPRDCRS